VVTLLLANIFFESLFNIQTIGFPLRVNSMIHGLKTKWENPVVVGKKIKFLMNELNLSADRGSVYY